MCKDRLACQICIAVTEVDGEINQVVAVHRRLMAKRRDLRSEHNSVHGTLIHRLTDECAVIKYSSMHVSVKRSCVPYLLLMRWNSEELRD